jgi:5'-nucleotidase
MGRFHKLAGLGGLEQLCKKVQQVRGEGGQVLLLDAGNMMYNGADNRDEQLQFYQTLAGAGYDAVVPGKADLCRGTSYFQALARESRLPEVSLQYERNTPIMGGGLPYYRINKGNLQVAVIDGSTYTLKSKSLSSVSKAVAAASRTAAVLKQAHPCLLTICMVQEEDSKSRVFAEASSHLDIIASTAPVSGLQSTLVIRNSKNEEVLLSRAGEKGTIISRIDLTYNEHLEKTHIHPGAVLVGEPLVKYAGQPRQEAYSKV